MVSTLYLARVNVIIVQLNRLFWYPLLLLNLRNVYGISKNVSLHEKDLVKFFIPFIYKFISKLESDPDLYVIFTFLWIKIWQIIQLFSVLSHILNDARIKNFRQNSLSQHKLSKVAFELYSFLMDNLWQFTLDEFGQWIS